jgi:hypothetical protein
VGTSSSRSSNASTAAVPSSTELIRYGRSASALGMTGLTSIVTTQHVIFGSGPLGRAVAREPADQGDRVRLVSRGRPQPIAGVETVAADVINPAQAAAASAGAAVLYQCMNADYGHWPKALPPLMNGFIAAANAVGARAVHGDNLYSYGPVSGVFQAGLSATRTGRNVRIRTELGNPDLPHTFTFIEDFARALGVLGTHARARAAQAPSWTSVTSSARSPCASR